MFCLVSFILAMSMCANGYPYEKELHQYLFTNYSKFVFPSDIVGQPVNITIHAEMNYIIGLDERTQLLTSDLQLIVTWQDNTLIWEDSQFGGIKDIHVPVDRMWLPDLAIQNALTERRRLAKDDQLVKIMSNGTVEWISDYVGPSLCTLTMTKYPFDNQTCAVYIESLSHGSDKVMIVAVTSPNTSGVFKNGQWELVATSSKLTHESSGDSVALVVLHIKRRRMYYIITTVLPSVITSCLSPFVFLLPAESGEKLSLSTTLLLFYSVMLTYIFDNIPSTSLSMPVMGLFIGGQLVLSALSLICTVVMLHFRHRDGKKIEESKENEESENSATETLQAYRLFKRLNTVMFVLFSLAEVTICLTIFIIIVN